MQDPQPPHMRADQRHTTAATTTAAPTPVAAGAVLQPTSTTIIIDGHTFTLPNDPLEAFHATRTQTIASFRAVAAGTATASDISFIFGAVVAPGGTASTSYLCAVSSDSGAAELAPVMSRLVPARYSGCTRDIKIDSHTFILPTDAVDTFLATREMAIAAFRKVAAGEAAAGDGRDMAFVFGTAVIATEIEKVTKRHTRITGGESTTAAIAKDTEEVGIEDHEEDSDGDRNYATASSKGGFSPRSWKDLTLAVPFLSQGLRRQTVRDTTEVATSSTASTPTSIVTPVPTATNTADSRQTITPATTATAVAPRYIADHELKTFIGNCRDLEHAGGELSGSASWLEGIHVGDLFRSWKEHGGGGNGSKEHGEGSNRS